MSAAVGLWWAPLTALVGFLTSVSLAAADDREGKPVWSVSDATRASDAKPRVLLTYDMEGLSGQDDVFTWQDTHPQYAKGQRLLTDDVNAVIEGLFAGGAGTVSVLDCHGGGNIDIDILVDEIDSRATRITQKPVECNAFAQPGAFDALVTVGMHAKSGSGGFSAHTATLGVEVLLNGRAMNETEMSALAYGEAGIPVIFASGDDVLGNELKSMPWIEYVAVKKSLGPMSAVPSPLNEARAALRAGAQRAIENSRQAKVPSMRGPVSVTVRAFPPADFSWLKGIPGVALEGDSMSVTAGDYKAAMIAARPLINAAMHGPTQIVLKAAQRHPEWKKIERDAVDELMKIWNEQESARRSGH